MGLFDILKGVGRGSANTTQNQLITAVLGMIGSQQGGLEGFVNQLAGKGLGDIVNSWVSTGQNMPISVDQLKQALGNNAMSQLSTKTGIAPEQLTSQLTKLLPQIVDGLTPKGQIPKGDIASQGMDLLKNLMK